MTYSREEIIPVRAKVRFSTLIVLPDNEEILDFTTGDKEFWIVNGAHNLCYVHPAQAGIRSNLNLITASGNVYSFLLTEISERAERPARSEALRPAERELREARILRATCAPVRPKRIEKRSNASAPRAKSKSQAARVAGHGRSESVPL